MATPTNNHNRFPNNVLKQKQIIIDNYRYTIYPFRFKGTYDLYNYLKKEPEINQKIFTSLSSITCTSDFAGKPYEEAVENLIKDIDPGYKEFLKIERKLNANTGKIHKYETIKSVAGGHVNVPLYTAGSPFVYDISRKISKPRFINLHVTLSYPWHTQRDQVFNRAIIITNIVKALEQAGYSVNINAFELSEKNNELLRMDFDIKKHGQKINYQALYKSLCNVEFLRRLLFRVIETSDVLNYWNDGYGATCEQDFTKKVLNIKKDDLYFDTPTNMNITGQDLLTDFENTMTYLKLGNILDVNKEKKDFANKVKILKK